MSEIGNRISEGLNDFAARFISKLESLDTSSADVLRTAAYRFMDPLIEDVPLKVAEARRERLAALQRLAERSANIAARRRARVQRIPELAAIVQTGNPEPVRAMLKSSAEMPAGERWHIDDIAARTGTTRRYVAAVRDLEQARKDKAWLRENRCNDAAERRKRVEARKAYGDPTKERIRQAGGDLPAVAKVVGDLRTHTFKWPVDHIRHLLSIDQYAAAQSFRDAHLGSGGRAKVANWEASGGGNPATKLAVTPAQERAGREFDVFWKALGRNATAKDIAVNFILEEPVRGNNKPLSFVEWGRRYAQVSGEQQARGIAQGLLWLVCSDLAAISREFAHYMKQEQRAVLRVMRQHTEIAVMISRYEEDLAVQTLCRLVPVKQWIIRQLVRKLIRDGRKRAEEEQEVALMQRFQKETSAA